MKKYFFKTVLMMLSISISPIFGGKDNDKSFLLKTQLEKFDSIVETRIDQLSEETKRAIATGIAGGTAIAGKAAQAKVAAAWLATKGTVVVAGPYIAGGAALLTVCYGGYKYYQSCQPSAEKVENERAHRDFEAEKKFEQCLHENEQGPFNKHKVPTKCEEEFKNFILIAGKQRADIKLEAFHEFAGISTSKF